jgi:hypothetical protein
VRGRPSRPFLQRGRQVLALFGVGEGCEQFVESCDAGTIFGRPVPFAAEPGRFLEVARLTSGTSSTSKATKSALLARTILRPRHRSIPLQQSRNAPAPDRSGPCEGRGRLITMSGVTLPLDPARHQSSRRLIVGTPPRLEPGVAPCPWSPGRSLKSSGGAKRGVEKVASAPGQPPVLDGKIGLVCPQGPKTDGRLRGRLRVQEPTRAPQQHFYSITLSVRASAVDGNVETKRLRGLQIDDQLVRGVGETT